MFRVVSIQAIRLAGWVYIVRVFFLNIYRLRLPVRSFLASVRLTVVFRRYSIRIKGVFILVLLMARITIVEV